tara:strand:+ start:30370 stop:30483 length:114 start_codon:yes stop_codon:yes gene_type:complete
MDEPLEVQVYDAIAKIDSARMRTFLTKLADEHFEEEE